MVRGSKQVRVRRATGWTGAILGLALMGGTGVRLAFSQGTAPATDVSPLNDAWQGDKLDPKWRVTVLGDAQDQENTVTVENGKLLIKGGGSDVWVNGDNGTFIWQRANGDFDVILQVHNIERTDPTARVGIMVRSSLNKYSPNVFLAAMPKGGNLQVRLPEAVIGDNDTGPGSSCPGENCVPWGDPEEEDPNRPVILLRLSRKGNVFDAHRSFDNGKTWERLHRGERALLNTQTVNLPDDVLIGIGHTSHNTGQEGLGVVGPIQFIQTATRPTDNGLLVATATDENGKPVPDVGLIVKQGDKQAATSIVKNNAEEELASNTDSFFLKPGLYTIQTAESATHAAGAPVPFEVKAGQVEELKVKVGTAL
jgi:hypothetical protein